MELSNLYSDQLLALAANAPQPGRLTAPDTSVRKVSRICGSAIEVDLVVRDGVIVGYGQALSACAIGQASTAVVAREIAGTPVGEFLALREAVTAMLKGTGKPPDGRWADLAWLEPVRDYPARHGSALLVFDAVAEAIGKIESDPPLVAGR